MPLRFALLLLLVPLSSVPAAAQPTVAQPAEDWQQRVAYDMDVTLLADRHQMRGRQRLTYTNNSPDTLRTVFYHLYFNAFQPQSMMAERNRQLPDPDGRVVPRIFHLGPDEIGYHRVESLTQDGQPVSYEVTDTVLRVDLAQPILPGEETVFEMAFRSQVPLQTRRSGRDNHEGIDYSMSQWYPKLAEYDRRGWHADPYVGREFYAPFGTFDVRITLPAAYTIGSTGTLQNPDTIGHGYDRPGRYAPTVGASSSSAPVDSLTWHYRAEDVHDFAWAADPDFIHEHIEASLQGRPIAYHLLYQPGVADRWQPMSDWVPEIISFFSEEYGAYPYPQFTVAQAGDGGMEYPMINFITGRRSPFSLLGVTAHEAGHEWFYAVLANNEADYAWMDEGFTSYATTEGVGHVLGEPNPSHQGAALSVLSAQERGLYERVNTPADWFETNAGYGVAAYSAGEMVVDMLGYVLSDSLQHRWLRAYFDRYTFRHVDPQDAEKVAEDVSGLRLDWYFEQFLNTTHTLDYALTDLDAQEAGGSWNATLHLKRKAEIVMPVDVRLTLADGSEHWATIPLGVMQGHKPIGEGWTVAAPWTWTFPEYTLRLKDLPARPVKAEIDPDGRTPDKNRLNNTSGFPVEARFLEAPGQSWFDYSIGYRPLAQYAHDFGPALGVQARGQYLFGQYGLEAMVKVWPQVLFSGGEDPDLVHELPPTLDLAPGAIVLGDGDLDVSFFDGIDYALRYANNIELIAQRATASLTLRKHQGLLENRLGLAFPLDRYGSDAEQRLSVDLVHQLNPTDRAFGANYRDILFGGVPEEPAFQQQRLERFIRLQNPFRREHMLSARVGYAVSEDADRLALTVEAGSSLRSLFDGPPQSATRFSLRAQKSAALGPLRGLASFAFGLGADDLALHKQFRLGAASWEESWRSDAFRTAASAFAQPVQDAHLVAFDGSGPVAYTRREVPERFTGYGVGGPPSGSHLLSGRLALQTGALSQNALVRPMRLEAFSGIGQVWSDGAFLAGFDAGDLLADAGLGLRYDVAALPFLQPYTAQSNVLSGLDLVAQFPFWASDPDRIEAGQDAFAFRWLLGLQTAF